MKKKDKEKLEMMSNSVPDKIKRVECKPNLNFRF